MQRKHFIPSILVVTILLAACTTNVRANPVNPGPTAVSLTAPVTETSQAKNLASASPEDCPVTVPQDPPFEPPPPYDRPGFEGQFWYGSSALWTAVPRNGTWQGLPYNPGGYTQKVFWWSEGYDREEEPVPALAVTAERIDALARPGNVSKATNAFDSDIGTAMLVGVDLPTPGCWKITGMYEQAELSFVVWISP